MIISVKKKCLMMTENIFSPLPKDNTYSTVTHKNPQLRYTNVILKTKYHSLVNTVDHYKIK